MKRDEIAIPVAWNHPTTFKHCETIKFNTDAFIHKKYPTCKCGMKFVPMAYRKTQCHKCFIKNESKF